MENNIIKIGDYYYELTVHGVLRQIQPVPIEYNDKYVLKYDGDEYKRNNEVLQALRYSFIIGSLGHTPLSILDFGCGNGAFLQFCSRHITAGLYGYDVAATDLSDREIHKVKDPSTKVEVVTFFDSLEHVLDIKSTISKLDCKMISISLPWCHHPLDIEWMTNWRHLRPNEHLWHFDRSSLSAFMKSLGWYEVASSCHEDIVRIGQHRYLPNILSMNFLRK